MCGFSQSYPQALLLFFLSLRDDNQNKIEKTVLTSKLSEKNVVVFSEMAWQNSTERRIFNQQFWSCVSRRDDVEIQRLGFEQEMIPRTGAPYD